MARPTRSGPDAWLSPGCCPRTWCQSLGARQAIRDMALARAVEGLGDAMDMMSRPRVRGKAI
jgi:hypothetical protein